MNISKLKIKNLVLILIVLLSTQVFSQDYDSLAKKLYSNDTDNETASMLQSIFERYGQTELVVDILRKSTAYNNADLDTGPAKMSALNTAKERVVNFLSDKTYTHKEYFENGNIESEGPCSALTKVYTEVKEYYLDGSSGKSKKLSYEFGHKNGAWNYYSDNGQLYKTVTFKDNKQVGEAVLYSIKYCMAGDCENGYGCEYYSGNHLYTGFFKNGEKHGIGLEFLENGNVFNGNWENGKREGFGVDIGTQYPRYVGYYKNGKFDGYGDYYLSEMQGNILVSRGEFKQGEFIENYQERPDSKTEDCIQGNCKNGYGIKKVGQGNYKGFFLDNKFYAGHIESISNGKVVAEYFGEMLQEDQLSGLGLQILKEDELHIFGNRENNLNSGPTLLYYLDDNQATVSACIAENGEIAKKILQKTLQIKDN